MRTRPRSVPAAAVSSLAAAALVLAGCGTDAAGGPQQAVQERLDRGVSVEVTIEADPAGIDDADMAASVQDLLDAQADGPLVVLSRSGDGRARGVVLEQGAVEARLVDDTAYLHLDTAALSDGDASLPGPLGELLPSDLPTPDDTGPSASAPPDLAGGLGGVLGALGDDGWIGVSGVTPERLAEMAGETDGTPSDQDMDAVRDLFADKGLDSWTGLLDEYATVTGDGPWEVTVDARALATALEDVEANAEALLGVPPEDDENGEAHDGQEVDPADLPEQVDGVTIEATDGVATRMVVDLATVHDALHGAIAGDDATGDDASMGAALAAADARLVLTMVDVDDRTDTPADAAVVDIALLGAMMDSGGMEALDPED